MMYLDNKTSWNKHNERDHMHLALIWVQYTDSSERKSFTPKYFQIKYLHYEKRTKNYHSSENLTESAIKYSRKENPLFIILVFYINQCTKKILWYLLSSFENETTRAVYILMMQKGTRGCLEKYCSMMMKYSKNATDNTTNKTLLKSWNSFLFPLTPLTKSNSTAKVLNVH